MLGVTEVLTGIVIMAGGSLLQGAVGFGYGLMAVPLLLAVGYPAELAVPAMATGSLIQSTAGTYALRDDVPRREVIAALLVRIPFMLIGVWLLKSVASMPLSEIRRGVGILILVLVAIQAGFGHRPHRDMHPAWGPIAFMASGLLAGLIGMGGVPLVMWAMARPWTGLQTRAFFFASFATTIPLLLVFLSVAFGMSVGWGIVAGLVSSPVVYAGGMAGVKLGNRFSKPLLRRLAYGLIVLIALHALLPSAQKESVPPASFSREPRVSGILSSLAALPKMR